MKLYKKLIALVLAVSIIIVGVALRTTAKAEVGNNVISVTSTNSYDSKTEAYVPSYSGQITAKISASGTIAPGERIIVYYKTMDFTAISSLGDYQALDNYTELTSSKKEVTVSISVGKSKHIVDSLYNKFRFVVTDAKYSDGSSCKIDGSKNSIYCRVRSENEYKTASKNGYTVLEGYTTSKTFSTQDRSESTGLGRLDWKFSEYATIPDCYSDDRLYVSSGLAKPYLGGTYVVDSNHVKNWYEDDLWMAVSRNGERFIELKKEKKFDDTTIEVGYTGDNKYPSVYVSGRNKTYYSLVPNIDSSYLYFDYHIWDTNSPHFKKSSYDYIYMDSEKPVITGWSVLTPDIKSSTKIQVAARFSEPVQVINDTPILYCKMNNESSQYEQAFKYVYGSGTNTLIFECDAQELASKVQINVSVFVPYEITKGNDRSKPASIADFGLNASCTPNFTNLKFGTTEMNLADPNYLKTPLKVSLDLRNPQVQVNKYPLAKALFEHTAQVFINYADKNATVYYDFTTSEVAPQNYTYSVKNENVSIDKGIVTIAASGLNGEYYLHVKAVSYFGKSSGDVVIKATDGKAIKFDNKAPSIETYEDGLNTFINKKIFIKTDENPNVNKCDSGVGKVTMYYTTNPASYLNFLETGVLDSRINSLVVYDYEKGKSRLKFEAEDGGYNYYSIELSALTDEFIKDNLSSDGHNTFYIGFAVEDKAGNSDLGKPGNVVSYKDIVFDNYEFDIRDLFKTTLTSSTEPIITDKKDGMADEDVLVYAFTSDVENELTFTNKNLDGSVADPLDFDSIFHNGEEISKEDFIVDGSMSSTNAKISFKTLVDLSGYYEIVLNYSTKRTRTYKLYFSPTKTADTFNKNNALNGGELINYVYQLNNSKYFYKNEGELVITDKYYGDTSKAPTFSTQMMAKSYVEYYEYQDFQLYQVNEAQAQQLNAGLTAERLKAQGETHIAVAGDYYIRYKKADWILGDSTTSSWVYYYYGTGSSYSKIDINEVKKMPNLKNAFDKVVKTIVDNGEYIYLVDENLDKNGAPYLDPNQYHEKALYTNKTMTGQSFVSSISYTGDENIFSSRITVGKDNYHLASNYVFRFDSNDEGSSEKTYTKIFIKYGDGNYIEIQPKDVRLYDIANSTKGTGVYKILEMDKFGISIYELYADCTPPMITISTVANSTEDAEDIPSTIQKDQDGQTYSAKSITFTNINDSDSYSYIAIYKISAQRTTLYKVFSSNEIENGLATIENGYYLAVISDRSGNSYKIYFKANSTELMVKVSEIPNTSIKIECNRDSGDIQIYQIYRNNELITSEYSSSNVFKENGNYRIYVLDWFGNEYDENYEFTRDYPDIKWRYDKNDVSYIYDGSNEQKGMRIVSNIKETSAKSNNFTIYTNGTLSLLYPMGSDYSYRFEGKEPSTYKTVTMSGDTIVTINAKDSYTIVIYYTEFPDVEIIYDVIIDSVSPTVLVSIDEDEYSNFEIDEINDYVTKVQNGEIPQQPNGTYFVPTNIGYYKVEKDALSHVIANNSIISSNYITVELQDVSVVVACEVYLDGKLINNYTDEKGIKKFILTKSGTYKIVCFDSLDNCTIFNFKNSFTSDVNIKVDDEIVSTGINKENYGSRSIELVSAVDGYVVFLVQIDDDPTKYYFSFYIENGEVRRCRLTYTDKMEKEKYTDEDGTEKYKEEKPIGIEYNIDEVIYKSGSQTLYTFGKEYGLDFQFRYVDKKYVFTMNANKKHDYTVEAKYYNDVAEPMYTKIILSNVGSSIDIDADGDVIKLSDTLHYINKEFKILKPNNKSIVTKIEIVDAMSEKRENILIYDASKSIYKEVLFEKFSIYQIKVTNIYGIVSDIFLLVSNEFSISKKVIYLDGTSITYSEEFNEIIYSNKSVELSLLVDSPKLEVTKNGAIIDESELKISNDGHNTILTLDELGVYVVRATDEYGNVRVINVEILNKIVNLPGNILKGYNEKAMQRFAGYTNNMLTVDLALLESNMIGKVYYINKDKEVVLYDVISEGHIIYDQDMLKDIIGKNGNGTYKVIFRNYYGNESQVDIHYSNQSTLSLSRLTRSSGNYSEFDLEEAITKGFYSNGSLKFSTTANVYSFKVNGESMDLDKVLSFEKAVESGVIDYEIYYLDEYGFEYSFKAGLYRVNVEVVAEDLDIFTDVDGLLTTNQKFRLTYTNDSKCSYILNNEKYDYDGSYIKKDGIYRFTVVDFAGNVSSVTYAKDSICEYRLYDSFAAKPLVNGDVANNKKVAFQSVNQDSVSLKKIYLNGKEISKVEEDIFTENGHYELLIEDLIGNTSFFEFYIITGPMVNFEYATPYSYKVVSIDYTNSNGQKISVLDYVDQFEYYSKFKFGTFDNETGFAEDGLYEVVMYSNAFNEYSTFNFTISNEMPKVELVGVKAGEETLSKVTLKGYSIGDTIKIYKDGKLNKTIKVTSTYMDSPVISAGGNYVIEITNEAGITQTLKFVKTRVSNGAGSALIIMASLAAVSVLFIGLLYRTKSRIDR